ncbi:MAG: phage tail protein [Leptospirales bacterium]|jgi:phage tail-like protein
MATGDRIDPFLGFRFRVEIDGIQTAAFSEATIPDTTTATADYREGTDPKNVRKLSALNSYGNVTLKKGLSASRDISDWQRDVEQFGAGRNRRTISLILVDDEGVDSARWDIIEAWPTKINTTGMNATGNAVMIETLEIVNEGITRVA